MTWEDEIKKADIKDIINSIKKIEQTIEKKMKDPSISFEHYKALSESIGPIREVRIETLEKRTRFPNEGTLR
tara:strand:- start:1101 stop:1316 length:216 start_codon:yes stop_codon:yes gene_type:complete